MMVDWVLLGLRLMAPLLLYLFLGRIIYQLQRQKRRPRDFLRRLDQPEVKLPLEGEVSLGRQVDNTFTLDSDYISPHQATIVYHDGRWWLSGVRGAHETLLNGRPLQTSVPLKYGDVVSLGDIQFRLERGG